jgi:hypothetical protein
VNNMSLPDHIRGASFTRLMEIPEAFGDGYFVGWTVSSQVREPGGKLVGVLVCEWLNPATTRHLKLRQVDTTAWPAGELDCDVKFVRTADGEVIKSTTARFTVGAGETQ